MEGTERSVSTELWCCRAGNNSARRRLRQSPRSHHNGAGPESAWVYSLDSIGGAMVRKLSIARVRAKAPSLVLGQRGDRPSMILNEPLSIIVSAHSGSLPVTSAINYLDRSNIDYRDHSQVPEFALPVLSWNCPSRLIVPILLGRTFKKSLSGSLCFYDPLAELSRIDDAVCEREGSLLDQTIRSG
jgi:hypothetical protein